MSGILSGCAVTVDNPNDMSLAVAAGSAMFGSTEVDTAGGAVVVTAADASLPRFDLVTLDSDGTVEVIAGVAAQNPGTPDPGADLVLAQVFVPAAATKITNNNLADRRQIVGGVFSVAGRSGAVVLTPADSGLTVTAADAALTDSTGGTPAATLVATEAALTDSTTGVVGETLKLIRTDTLAHAVSDISDNFASLNEWVVDCLAEIQNNTASLNAQINATVEALQDAGILT